MTIKPRNDQTLKASDGVQASEPKTHERRRYKRVTVPAKGHVMTGGQWYGCQVSDISGGGVSAKGSVALKVDTHVMFKMRGLGLVRCKVVQSDGDSFSLVFNLPEADRDRLIDNLILRHNQHLFGEEGTEDIDDPSRDSALSRLMPRKMLSKLHGLLRGRD